MGYFSNGSEGEIYRARWCDRCLHDQKSGCAVYLAHLMFNYDQCKDSKLADVLSVLIPRTKDGLDNEQCKMFVKSQP